MAHDISDELIRSFPPFWSNEMEWAQANRVRVNWKTYSEIEPVFEFISREERNGLVIQNMLEIGVFWGISSLLFSKFVNLGGKLVGVDSLEGFNMSDEDRLGRVKPRIEMVYEQIRVTYGIKTDFRIERSIDYLTNTAERFDLIHVDGLHTLDGFLYDVILSYARLNPGGVIICDDVEMYPNGQNIPGSALGWRLMKDIVSELPYTNGRYAFIRKNLRNDQYFGELITAVRHRRAYG